MYTFFYKGSGLSVIIVECTYDLILDVNIHMYIRECIALHVVCPVYLSPPSLAVLSSLV